MWTASSPPSARRSILWASKPWSDNSRGIIAADEATYRTSVEGVFGIGDATNKGASIAIAAIGEGDRCAEVVDSYLNGNLVGYRKPYVSERQVSEKDFADREKIARIQMPVRPAEERKHDFKEINLGFAEDAAQGGGKALPGMRLL